MSRWQTSPALEPPHPMHSRLGAGGAGCRHACVKGEEPPPRPGRGGEILLYIHVPFCRSKCAYCAFHSVPLDQAALEGYFQSLLKEIRFFAEQERHSRVVSLAIGGGTPSLLPLPKTAALLDCIAACFHCQEGMEVTFEANPDSAWRLDDLRALRSLGVTRMSLGIQSFDDADLAALGRRHSAARGLEAAQAAKRAGFESLNLDLLFGLPGQSVQDWLWQLATACRIGPEHLSCYALTPEPGTALAEQLLAGQIRLPDDEEQAAMFLRGGEYLADAGYEHYEISNFARGGAKCRHNLGYWQGWDYLGFGPAAVSTRAGRRRRNPLAHSAYADLAERGRFHETWQELSPAEQADEQAMLRLRLKEGLDPVLYRRLTGRNIIETHGGLIRALLEAGLLLREHGRIRLSPRGMLVSNAIIAEFFQDS